MRGIQIATVAAAEWGTGIVTQHPASGKDSSKTVRIADFRNRPRCRLAGAAQTANLFCSSRVWPVETCSVGTVQFMLNSCAVQFVLNIGSDQSPSDIVPANGVRNGPGRYPQGDPYILERIAPG